MKLAIFFSVTVLVALVLAFPFEVNKLLSWANRQFSTKMFFEVIKVHPGESVVLSAFSVLTPLIQFIISSQGQTQNELLQVTGLPDVPLAVKVASTITDSLNSVKGVTIAAASRVYVTDKVELTHGFKKLSKYHLSSDFKLIDFSRNVDAAKQINNWVKGTTRGLITNVIDSAVIHPDTKVVLVNSIYFKGLWKIPFNPQATKYREFYPSTIIPIYLPTMCIDRQVFRYGEDYMLGVQYLELPYAGNEASLLLVLPNQFNTLGSIEQKVMHDNDYLNIVREYLQETFVNVCIPKFKIETTTNLVNVLNKMGIKKLFTPDAELNALVRNGDLDISYATQKALIEVTEEGTEAAAGNVFGSPISLHTPKNFIANRPFYFAIIVHGRVIFNGHFLK